MEIHKLNSIRLMRYSLILCLLFPLLSLSQNSTDKTQLELEVDYTYGNILEHRASIKHLIKGHPEGLMLTLNKKTFGKKRWEALYNYPDYGLSFTYQDMKNEVLGEHYSLYGHLTFYFLNRNLTFRVAQGFTYNTNPYDKETNFRNTAYGTSIMPSTYFLVNYKKKNIYKGWGFQTGFGIHHYSNARMKAPNTSTNTVAFNFGLNYDFDSDTPEYIGCEKTNYTEPIKINVAFRSGVSSSAVVGSKQYPFYVFSAYADKRTSEKSSFQLGADVFLMEYVKEHLYFLSVAYPEGNEDATSIDYKRVGVFGGYEIHFSKLSIEGQMGVYVYAPFSAEEAVYQRLSSKYLITDHIFAGLGLKTHMAKAEALEFSIGYSF